MKNITSEICTVDNNWLCIIIIVINTFFQNISVPRLCDAVCCSKIAPCRKYGWSVTSLRILEEQYVETNITNPAARFTVFGDGARFCTGEIYRYSQTASSRGSSVTLYPRECLNTSKYTACYSLSFTSLYFSFFKVALLPKKMLLLQLQQVYSSESKPRGHDRMSAERDTNLTAAQSGLQVSVQRDWPTVCF